MVAQQTNEIRIRMALGAGRGRVIQLVLRRAFQRVAAGLIVGLPLAVGAARLSLHTSVATCRTVRKLPHRRDVIRIGIRHHAGR